MEGSGQSCVVHIPHRWPQVGLSSTSPRTATRSQAAHSLGLPGPSSCPFTGETSQVVPLSPAPGGTAPPLPRSGLRQGAQQGLVAQRIHSCGKAGSWGFQLHTWPSPETAAVGEAPPGPEWKSGRPDSQRRLAPTGPLLSSLAASTGQQPGGLRRPAHLCNLPPKQQSPGATLAPPWRTPLPQSQQQGSRSQLVRPAGLRGPRCANCWHPSFQLPQWPTVRGREGKCSLGGQAGQVRGAQVPTAPK